MILLTYPVYKGLSTVKPRNEVSFSTISLLLWIRKRTVQSQSFVDGTIFAGEQKFKKSHDYPPKKKALECRYPSIYVNITDVFFTKNPKMMCKQISGGFFQTCPRYVVLSRFLEWFFSMRLGRSLHRTFLCKVWTSSSPNFSRTFWWARSPVGKSKLSIRVAPSRTLRIIGRLCRGP